MMVRQPKKIKCNKDVAICPSMDDKLYFSFANSRSKRWDTLVESVLVCGPTKPVLFSLKCISISPKIDTLAPTESHYHAPALSPAPHAVRSQHVQSAHVHRTG